MKPVWHFDTEFNDDGRTIDLISIAFVSSTGLEYYAVSSEFDESRLNGWVRQHVLPQLPPRTTWKPRHVIAAELKQLLTHELPHGEKAEIWAYFADYDWVAFCQLFGPMIDLPAGLPMFCFDLKQEMQQLGVKRSDLPPQAGPQHDALADARWVMSARAHLSRMLFPGLRRFLGTS